MKLSHYAKQLGVTYRTVWNWYNAGKLDQLSPLADEYLRVCQLYIDQLIGERERQPNKCANLPPVETRLSARWQRCAWQQASDQAEMTNIHDGNRKDILMPYNQLSAEEEGVIVDKGTERPFSGEYETLFSPGVFTCRRCNNPLYSAEAKFKSGCGWPSFDEEYPEGVERRPDADGRRTEIVCAHCGGHLGHVFEGEGFTEKDTRHCVNSLSIRFIPEGRELPPVLDAD